MSESKSLEPQQPNDHFRSIYVKASEIAGYKSPAPPYTLATSTTMQKESGRGKLWEKLKAKTTSASAKPELVHVRVRQSEYEAYFAKDKRGAYLSSTQEPPGGRAEWLRNRVEERKELAADDPDPIKNAHWSKSPMAGLGVGGSGGAGA